ncbi:phage major tail tube protein [Cupriavidus metallidurans]|uniref:Phage major tail tube protein n=1 Tax=Cupriavidus metallidurans TaxID=119219 RepID=A0A482IPK0_9BURK|nr:phage major tail tube protein [Cupriavidus metallidurans]QBP09852.1 phage major tail tube protein [Cupriavidus metallidurans]
MSQIKVRQIVNANVYLEGMDMLGQAEEVKIPEISVIESEYKGLGMVGKIKLPAGIDAMEAEIKWKSYFEEAMRRVANPFAAVQVQIRSNVEDWDSTGRQRERPLVTYLTVLTKKVMGSTFKQQERTDFPSSYNVHYIRQVFDGNEELEVDVFNNIFKINGQDALAQYRLNIGG